MKTIEEIIQENEEMINERRGTLDRVELIQEVKNEMERVHLAELEIMLEEIKQAVLANKTK